MLINREPTAVIDPSEQRFMDEKVLGIRRLAEYFYQQSKKAERRATMFQKETAGREQDLIIDMIRVADSFEDVFRAFAASRKLSKQKHALGAFTATFDTLVHVLENRGVHQVPIEGKSYGDVVFGNARIPEPWTVVAGENISVGKEGRKIVSKVLRPLWVRVMGGEVFVLRRAQVTMRYA